MVHRGFPFESFSVASMGAPLLGLMIRWPTMMVDDDDDEDCHDDDDDDDDYCL